MDDLKKLEQGNPESLTDQAKAEILLTERIGAHGNDVPSGEVSIAVKHQGSKKKSTYKLEWMTVDEEIKNDKVYKGFTAAAVKMAANIPRDDKSFLKHPFLHKSMRAGFYKPVKDAVKKYEMAQTRDPDDDFFVDPLGSKKSFIPYLGQLLWQNPDQSNFHAYIYMSPGQKRIGYIRISDYEGGAAGAANAAQEFAELIAKFQRDTDALVIDQIYNPGGEVFYMYALASMLTNKPFDLPTHRETITQEDVLYALNNLKNFKKFRAAKKQDENISGYPITPELVESISSHLTFVIDEWNAGRTFTNPGYLYGIQKLQPHQRVNFTKPLLILVNEMAFSCGDFLPAILQDNKRATIFGTQTAGAGGYVIEQTHPNLFGIQEYTFTASVAERLDKKPIENLGVTPDIIYNLTTDDLQNNYVGYMNAVNSAVDGLFKKK